MSPLHRLRTRAADDRGLMGPAAAMLVLIVLMVAALVFDGGRALAAKRQIINQAEAAARAAVVDATITGLDTPRADAAARSYLASVGVADEQILWIDVTDTNVTVALQATSNAVFGELAGVQTYRVTGVGEAAASFGGGSG